jgi:hypothetical protein
MRAIDPSDEGAYAESVTSRIPARLRQSQVVLSRPREHRYHSLGHKNHSAIEKQDADLWIQGGEHHLLMKLISKGIVPEGKLDGPEYPPSHHDAQRIAAERGYRVPSDFYNQARGHSSEDEAWYALQEMLRGSPGVWKGDAPSSLHREIFADVAQIRAQFIVPRPSHGGPPYVINQLWIVRAGDNRVRLVCLEIDGEAHIHESRAKAEARDEDLTLLGYGVYHVAGWWCRVDSYRVICEFLAESGIHSKAVEWLLGSSLKRIDDYVCARCEEPMIRWEDNWIQEAPVHGARLPVHRSCVRD